VLFRLNPHGKEIIKRYSKSNGTFKQIDPSHIVATHRKIMMPVSTAVLIIAAVKEALVSTSKPTVYI
jgi:hypothetical protein